MNEFDALLSQPIAAVADNGFSARVMRRVRIEQIRSHGPTIAAFALCAALLVVLLPFHAIGGLLGAAFPQLAQSWAVNLAAWLVVVCLLAARPLSRL